MGVSLHHGQKFDPSSLESRRDKPLILGSFSEYKATFVARTVENDENIKRGNRC